MKIEIKNRWDGFVLFAWECEENTLRLPVLEAVKAGADLRNANLSDANLSDANLSGAVLDNTCLAISPSPWQWTQINACPTRILDGRVLILGARTQQQIVMGGADYETGKTYSALVFSRCPNTSCHPGLYIAGGPECDLEGERMLVAAWLDELHIVGKCRVPRFRTLVTREDFDKVTTEDMDEGETLR